MPITNSKQDWSIGKLGFRATMAKIKQQELEIDDLQKENEALKATIAREKQCYQTLVDDKKHLQTLMQAVNDHLFVA